LALVESILKEDERARELEELPGYGTGILLSYLEDWGEQLCERTRNFLGNILVLDRHFLRSLREAKKDLYEGPYLTYEWSALIPRLFVKLVHTFGHPSLKVLPGGHGSFFYLFLYKGQKRKSSKKYPGEIELEIDWEKAHIIAVYDWKGDIVFQYYTIAPESEKETEVTLPEDAEEVLKEFAENMLHMVMEPIPLDIASAGVILF